jgi:Rrf2 family protein
MQTPPFSSFTLFELPSRVKYALLALIELAKVETEQKAVTVKEIATKQPISERYLEQVLLSLRQGGLVQSYRGIRGGYVLTREPWQITLFDVVISVEGQQTLKQRLPFESLERTMIHQIWQEAQIKVQDSLKQQTIEDLRQKCVESN